MGKTTRQWLLEIALALENWRAMRRDSVVLLAGLSELDTLTSSLNHCRRSWRLAHPLVSTDTSIARDQRRETNGQP